jgi:hypothetical protein
MRSSARGSRRLSEAEVVYWLKHALTEHGLDGRPVRNILVDADPNYLNSPFSRRLEPTGLVWIADRRADLACVVEQRGTEYLAAFEVKAESDHERGVIQASRYRAGVHQAFLCIPSHESPVWLQHSARQNGVGLVRASPTALQFDVRPARPQPDPHLYLVTRRYLLGESGLRALQLNKPLHYAAALWACAFHPDPNTALIAEWGLGESAVRGAMRGAETLGLLDGGVPTIRGRAYADILRALGFDLRGSRALTRVRLVNHAPGLAAALRSILLTHPAVDLIARALALSMGSLPITQLATRAHALDEGTARALFGPPPEPGQPWPIRPSTRFQLKAALYDVGLLDSPLAPGASRIQAPGGYDPSTDFWHLSSGGEALASAGSQPS